MENSGAKFCWLNCEAGCEGAVKIFDVIFTIIGQFDGIRDNLGWPISTVREQ
jgi:hypothetical protein